MKQQTPSASDDATCSANWRCNACGKIVTRKFGWKIWTPSYCEQTGKNARLWRISAPTPKRKSGNNPKTHLGLPNMNYPD